MRANEFITESILTEYSREITAKNLGARLATAARNKEKLIPDSMTDEDLAASVLAQLERADPTPNKKYTQWVARIYANTHTKLEDVLSTVQEYLYKFDLLSRRKKLNSNYSDINKYTSFENFMDVMDEFEMPAELQDNKGTSKVVFEDQYVRIIVPEDEAASCYYGQGTRWCTAATKGTNYFNRYSNQGPLYIILPKNPQYNGEKYQLHFESEQFMDENDDEVNITDLLSDRFPSTLEFFKQNAPLITSYIEYADNDVLRSALNQIREAAQRYINQTVDNYPELRDQVEEVIHQLSMSPKTLKAWAIDYYSGSTEPPKITEIDAVLYTHLESYGDGAELFSSVSDFINSQLYIKYDPATRVVDVRMVGN